MSLLASRVGMRHRCKIERDASSEGVRTGWNQNADPDWGLHLDDVPCRAWTESASEPVADRQTAAYEGRRLALPLGTNVTESDRIAEVRERGEVIFEGPMSIEGVQRFPDHLELSLERIR
jgi:hypothetical protein